MLHYSAGLRSPEGVMITKSLLQANADPNMIAMDESLSFEPPVRRRVRIHCLFSISIRGRVDRASATLTVDSGSISCQVKPKTIKLVFTASLFHV